MNLQEKLPWRRSRTSERQCVDVSDQIDDEDMDFMRHEFVTYSMASDYYGLGLKPVTRMAHECGAIYKIGRKILIRRSIFEEYLRQQSKI